MFDAAVIQNNMRDLVNTTYQNKGVSDVIVILPFQNVPRPKGAYLTCDLSSIQEIGREEIQSPDNTGVSQVYTQWHLIFTFDSYRDRAGTLLQNLNSFFRHPDVLEALYKKYLSFIRANAIIRVSDLLETSWEDRSQMEVTFATGDVDGVLTGYIQSTEIKGDFETSAGIIEKSVDIIIST